jgi:hypothetical protein
MVVLLDYRLTPAVVEHKKIIFWWRLGILECLPFNAV